MRIPLGTLRRRPALTLSVVAVLAIGIGAATAMFGVVRGVLLRPLPVRDQDRLVVSWMEQPLRHFGHWPLPYHAVAALAQRTRAYEQVAAVDYNGAYPQPLRRATSDDVIRANGTWVGGAFFDVLGVRPSLGRLLGTGDDLPNALPSIVLGERLWRRAFGGDPHIVGQTVRWKDKTWTIVGIAPAGFSYPVGAEFWVPIQILFPEAATHGSKDEPFAMVDVVGRLRPDATVAQARDELTRLFSESPGILAPNEHPAGWRAIAHPFAELVVGDVRPTLWALTAATLLVLVIACANVAALLLIAGAGRRELAVRAAIGASRRHLVRQLVAESAVLAASGAALGTLLATIAVRVVVAIAPPELPRLNEIRVDGVVLVFAVLCAAIATMLAGVAPALLLTRQRPESALRAAIADRRGHRVPHALAAAQLALALVVLSGAALLGRSLLALQRVDMGLATDRLVIANLDFPGTVYAGGGARYWAMNDALVARVQAIPGVASASFVNAGPFSGPAGWDAPAVAEGETIESSKNPVLDFEPAGATYFATLGIPIRRGRALTATDDRIGAAPVIVVSERAAAMIWPGRDPLGRRLLGGGGKWLTVVGVAADARYRDFLDPRPAMYIPPRPNGLPGLTSFAIRTRGDGLDVVPALHAALHEVEPGAVIVGAATMRELMATPLARPRLAALLLALFASAALLLAAVGVYGVMTALVAQRRREIGVRMALGARVADVLRWIMTFGAQVALGGTVLGLLGALATTRLLRTQLFGISPNDPLTLLLAALALGGIALLACVGPAWKAGRVAPREVLRDS